MKIVIAEAVTDKIDELMKVHNKDWIVYRDFPKDKSELIDRIKDAEAVSSYSIKYDREIFEACPKLKFLAIPSVGASYFVDMDAAKEYGVVVMNCPGYNSTAVAELAIGLAIDVLRAITKKSNELQEGHWNSEKPLGRLLSGKKIGLIGYGNVGKKIALMLQAWEVEMTFVTSKSSSNEVDELMKLSDVVFVCCPHTPKTERLVSADRLAMMQPDSIIVNVSRGSVIDEDALFETLEKKKIAGAGLDVFVNEPNNGQEVSSDIMRFLELPTVVCTPHTAGTSEESRAILSQMIFDNLSNCEGGNPINIFEG